METDEFLTAREEFEAGQLLLHAGLGHLSLKHYRSAARLLQAKLKATPASPADEGLNSDHSSNAVRVTQVVLPNATEDLAKVLAGSWPKDKIDFKQGLKRLRRIVYFSSTASTRLSGKKYLANLTLRRTLSELITTLALFVLLGLCVHIIIALDEKNATPRVNGSEEHYWDIRKRAAEVNAAVVYWTELGRAQKLTTDVLTTPGYSVELVNFHIHPPWKRKVDWHIEADDKGTVHLYFPPEKASHVAFYMTDGNTFWRMSRFNTPGSKINAFELHDGRWYILPITDAERLAGKKTVIIKRLTGDSVAVSAIAIFDKQGNSSEVGELVPLPKDRVPIRQKTTPLKEW